MGNIPEKILSIRVLSHILMWAEEAKKLNRFKWARSDQNIEFLIHEEIRKIKHETYLKQRENKKV